MSTRDKIMDVALNMFSERGYEAVSIRDICGEVGIKESTLYYHFKNKKDILDSLIEKFRTHIDGLLAHVDELTEKPRPKKGKKADDISLQMMDSYMIDSYLFDPFCNLMLRLMMIEQFHNEEIRALYEKTLFTDPYEIQLSVFRKLSSAGAIPE
ncbi:MAG: TetR/AcrR family transcriptional regulator, partial [Clostridiales bacterium]|nr:TetR/AcrR family transcriptional regulator [Clostridiales bacterium]